MEENQTKKKTYFTISGVVIAALVISNVVLCSSVGNLDNAVSNVQSELNNLTNHIYFVSDMNNNYIREIADSLLITPEYEILSVGAKSGTAKVLLAVKLPVSVANSSVKLILSAENEQSVVIDLVKQNEFKYGATAEIPLKMYAGEIQVISDTLSLRYETDTLDIGSDYLGRLGASLTSSGYAYSEGVLSDFAISCYINNYHNGMESLKLNKVSVKMTLDDSVIVDKQEVPFVQDANMEADASNQQMQFESAYCTLKPEQGKLLVQNGSRVTADITVWDNSGLCYHAFLTGEVVIDTTEFFDIRVESVSYEPYTFELVDHTR